MSAAESPAAEPLVDDLVAGVKDRLCYGTWPCTHNATAPFVAACAATQRRDVSQQRRHRRDRSGERNMRSMKSWQWLVMSALVLFGSAATLGTVGHARQRQAERQARRRRQGRLQAVRLHRSLGQDRRPRGRPRQRRRQAARRQRRAGAGDRGESHGVPQAGTHRSDDRDHGVQAGSRRGRRHPGAVLLRRRGQRVREEEFGTQDLGRPQGQADLRASRARTTTGAPARNSARSSSCSRA